MSKTINLGRVTAYADAVAAGYTGTREEFANDLANAANYAAEAGDAAETATEAATTASTAAETATEKAEEASADAEQAHADAQAILGAKETAVAAAATATSKAGEAANSAQQAAASETAAAGSATTASNAATSATASKNAAATSETNAANSANAAAQTLTNVNQAGATQVAAIQAKGTEVLNSIPADYTELSNDVDDLKSDLNTYANIQPFNVNNPGYIATNVGVGNTVDLTPVTNPSFVHTVIEVTPGMNITLNGLGWTTGRLWCFIDASNAIISVSQNTANAENLIITAPDNAVKCVINMYKTDVGSCFIGLPAVKIDKTLNNEGEAADAKVTGDAIRNISENVNKINNELYEPYRSMVQGGITSDGIWIEGSTTVRTEMIPLSAVKEVIKITNYALEIAVYDANGKFIAKDNYSHNVPFDITNMKERILSDYPTAGQIALSFRKVENDVSVPFSTNDYYSSDNEIYIYNYVLWNNAAIVVDGLSNKIFENLTLTDDFTFVIKNGNYFYKNILVNIDAVATGACTISATRRWLNRTGTYNIAGYNSPKYTITDNTRKNRSFRFPGGVYGMGEYQFTIEVPEGVTLNIKSLSVDFDNVICREAGIQLNAHGLCGFGGPPNTNIAFSMSAKLGYKYCITIPKVTSDGVYVCFHDDDAIQNALYNADGTEIASAYHNRPISDFTYSEILSFDAGVIRGQIFNGEKVPLLSDFFKICSETGMHPMLSVHPALEGHWENIKALAKKYNVLDKLNIKAPMGATLTAPMSVLLNDIESYTVDVNSEADAVSYMNSVLSTYDIDRTKVKTGIEYFLAYATDNNIAQALAAGYFVAVANITSDVLNTYASFIEKGVTQFTDDFVPCVGLNWY